MHRFGTLTYGFRGGRLASLLKRRNNYRLHANVADSQEIVAGQRTREPVGQRVWQFRPLWPPSSSTTAGSRVRAAWSARTRHVQAHRPARPAVRHRSMIAQCVRRCRFPRKANSRGLSLRANSALDGVGVQFHPASCEKHRQSIPVVQRVADCLGEGGSTWMRPSWSASQTRIC
jgi:hypothetical protein